MEKTHLSSLLFKKLITQHLIYFRCIFLLLLVSISTCAQTPVIHISTGTLTVGLGIENNGKQDSIVVFVSTGATIINAQELRNSEFKHEKNEIGYAKTTAKPVKPNVLSKVSKKLTPKREELKLVKESKSSEFFIRSQQKSSLILIRNQEIEKAYLIIESKFLLSSFRLKRKTLSRDQCIIADKIIINLKDRGPPYYV